MTQIKDIDLRRRTLDWFARRQYRGKGRGTLWASEASVEWDNEFGEKQVSGKCHRATWYRLNKVEETNPPTDWSQVIFLLGNSVETAVIEAWKQMGAWENNSVRWEDKERNISGEYDAILREGDMIYGVEVKSFYGYNANKQIMGHNSGRGANKRWIPGRPKDEHLMQASIYTAHARDDLDGFKLFYVSRDACDMKEFNITVDDEDNIYIDGFKETRFTLNDVYERYAKMNFAKDNNLKPDRDFVSYPSDERIKLMHERGQIAKTAYENHVKGKNKYMDWHCSYCNFKDHCLADKDEEEVETAVEIDEGHLHGSL